MSDKLESIKQSSELLAEEMDSRKERVLENNFTILRRAIVDLVGIAVAAGLVVYTQGLVWLILASIIALISAWGLLWKVVGSL